MEPCLRIAMWMCLLIGCLQANPICSEQGNLGFCYLRREVNCANVTFTSPTNVKDTCYDAALKYFKEGLERAMSNCEDVNQRTLDTLEALENNWQLTDSSGCTLETKESNFVRFVDNMEDFVQRLKAHSEN